MSHERPPIVVIVGHIDHGKSTLLDYIRRTNVVSLEAGGITQHLSAYEAEHAIPHGSRHITFLDTPGHEAFHAMRLRGLEVADVAVLVVSAEDGVKQQTLESLESIKQRNIPFVIAITKIDKPAADVERTKLSLLEHGVFLEGMGGDIPYITISSKTGEGVSELLDLILLAADLEGLSSNEDLPGVGVVIEGHVDPRRGNTATLIVKDGVTEVGEFIVSGEAYAPVRIMENFLGKPIQKALPGRPVRVVGFSILPRVGDTWRTLETKKQAEEEIVAERVVRSQISESTLWSPTEKEEERILLPLLIKTDVAGTGEAIAHEIEKIPIDARVNLRIVGNSVGPISESDVRLVSASRVPGIIVGFNVKIEREAKDVAERFNVVIAPFDIIYKLTDWIKEEIEKRHPKEQVEEVSASARLLKVFSNTHGKVVVGGRVEEGVFIQKHNVKIMRRDIEIGRGEIASLQVQKSEVKKVPMGSEFGALLKTTGDQAPGDQIVAYEIVYK